MRVCSLFETRWLTSHDSLEGYSLIQIHIDKFVPVFIVLSVGIEEQLKQRNMFYLFVHYMIGFLVKLSVIQSCDSVATRMEENTNVGNSPSPE